MSGVAGNFYTLFFGRQTAKGTPQTSPTYALKVTGGSLDATKTEIELTETDSTRQGGKTIATQVGVTGSPDMYVRPDDFGLLSYGLLGTNVDSGTSPNFIHTASMLSSGALPYFTIYKAIGGTVLVDRYDDCRIAACKLKGQAGQAITATWDIMGITPNFGQTQPVTSVVTQDPLVYPNLTVQRGGVVPKTIESFTIDLVNNADVIQADTALTPYDIVMGRLQASGTYTMLFESDADYRQYFTGSPTGTVAAQTLFSQRLEFNFSVNANLGVDIVFQSVAINAYPVPPDVSGKPIRVVVGWRSMPDAVTQSNYVQITTRNGVTSY